jgi:hypothetical protein
MEIKLNAEGNLLIDTTNEKKLKGYQYDSLVYRYIRAREHMAEHEWERDRSHDRTWYFKQAERDIMRFCQILNEAIGEHN